MERIGGTKKDYFRALKHGRKMHCHAIDTHCNFGSGKQTGHLWQGQLTGKIGKICPRSSTQFVQLWPLQSLIGSSYEYIKALGREVIDHRQPTVCCPEFLNSRRSRVNDGIIS